MVLLNFSDELVDNYVAGVLDTALLYKKAPATDCVGHAVEEEERFSCGRRFIEHLQDGDHLVVGD